MQIGSGVSTFECRFSNRTLQTDGSSAPYVHYLTKYSDVSHQPSSRNGVFWRSPYSPSVVSPNRVAVVEGSRIIQGGGQQWVVHESQWTSPGSGVLACLIFENDAVVRRVREFPVDWRTRSDADLYALSLVY